MRPELLAPAGDLSRMKTAIRYGADAVYLGAQQFGMRAVSRNFDSDELAQAVRYAHARGVRVYLTVNTLPHPDEIEALPEFLRQSAQCGADALIVADLGVLALCRRLLPGMELHASTQLGIVNQLTAQTLYEMGVRRAVLARELTLGEIAVIREKSPPDLELEAFVHGSMCMSVSGRCVLSNYLTGRDANRGECAQPCRWNYRLMEEKRPGLYIPVEEDARGVSILSAKDLCMLPHLDALVAAGVSAFKIEGRAKSIYYVGVVTNAYRAAVDALGQGDPPDWARQELDKISHREYSTGFYYGREPLGQTYHAGGYLREWEIAAVVHSCADGVLSLEQRNRFAVGETLELLRPGQSPESIPVTAMTDAQGESLQTASHPQMTVHIPYHGSAPSGAILRRERTEG